MNRLLQGLVVAAAFGFVAEAKAITQDQAIVAGALDALGFRNVTSTGVIGGPQAYTGPVKTPATFWLKSDGSITFKDPATSSDGPTATAEQGLIAPALEKLGFTQVKPKNGAVGGDMQFTLSRQAARQLRNKRFWLINNGTITFSKP